MKTGGEPYGRNVAIAVLYGVMAPMLNYGFAFGQPIGAAAVPETATIRLWTAHSAWEQHSRSK